MTVRLVPVGPEHDAAFEETSRDPLIHRFSPAVAALIDEVAQKIERRPWLGQEAHAFGKLLRQ